MLAQEIQTERINGADGGSLQQHPLAAESRIARLLLAPAEQRLPDPGAELCRRRIRKRDDEEAVGVGRAHWIGDEPDGALRQHSGLAASGGCTHQQRTAPVVDGCTLGLGPFGFAHGSSSSVSSGSKGLAGASSARSPMPVSWQQMKP